MRYRESINGPAGEVNVGIGPTGENGYALKPTGSSVTPLELKDVTSVLSQQNQHSGSSGGHRQKPLRDPRDIVNFVAHLSAPLSELVE